MFSSSGIVKRRMAFDHQTNEHVQTFQQSISRASLSPSLSLSLWLSPCVFLCTSQSQSVSVSQYLCLCLCLSVSPSLYMSLSVCVFYLFSLSVSLCLSLSRCLSVSNNNNNFRVSNIRVSNRTLNYNVCPKSTLTWPSRHSRHRHLCRFYRSLINR